VQATFGNIKAEALTRTEAARLHHSLAATPYQANRTLAALSALYTWSERHGHLPEGHGNPARGIKRYREQGRERFLTAEELNRLGEALREAETTGLPWETNGALKHLAKEDNRRTLVDPFAVAAVRLLILTGARLRRLRGYLARITLRYSSRRRPCSAIGTRLSGDAARRSVKGRTFRS
jgi:hypothetical protein